MDMQQLAAGAQGQPAVPAAEEGNEAKALDLLTQASSMLTQAIQMMGAGAQPEAAAQQAGFESVDKV